MRPVRQSYCDDVMHEDDSFVPVQSVRPFGAGIKRKRVTFVPATTTTEPCNALDTTNIAVAPGAGSRYLSIVLKESSNCIRERDADENDTNGSVVNRVDSTNKVVQGSVTTTRPTGTDSDVPTEPTRDIQTETCPICFQPVASSALKAHQSSIAHQVSLEHSHPPSHLDRRRKGLQYLEGYGWDPDSRLGLGPRNEGIRLPLKVKEKRDTTGLGLITRSKKDDDDDDDHRAKPNESVAREHNQTPIVRLNAKQTRKMEDEKRRKGEKLTRMFYGEDLSQYLGSSKGWER